MRPQTKKILTTGGILFLLMGLSKKSRGAGFDRVAEVSQQFVADIETFSPRPVWDYQQWSWGYGTRVPGSVNNPNINPGGSITPAQAWQEMRKVHATNYRYLANLLKRPLNVNQWAAWLSFAYNLGPANADNLVGNINRSDDDALFAQMRKYINAGGQPSQGLINRREKEIKLWKGEL